MAPEQARGKSVDKRADMREGVSIEAGKPVALFSTRIGFAFNNRFDVTKDGRFLIPVDRDETAPSSMTVLLNWTEALKK